MRFHMGVSFRPKQLIKWIIPILAILGILGISEAKAQEVENNQIYVDLRTLQHCGKDVTEYINYFESHKSDLYHIFVTYVNGDISLSFVPSVFDMGYLSTMSNTNNNNLYNLLSFGTNLSSEQRNTIYYSGFSILLDSNKCNNIDILDNVNAMSDFQDLMESYHTFTTSIPNSALTNFNASNVTAQQMINSTGRPYWGYYSEEVNGTRYASVVDETFNNIYVLWTDFPTFFSNNPVRNYNNNLAFNYNYIKINNQTYNVSDRINWDYQYQEVLTYDDYTQINDVYVYTSATDLNRVNFNINYQTRDVNWGNSNLNLVGVYGLTNVGNRTFTMDRINNSNCMWTSTTTNNSITFNGISCTIPNNYVYISLHFNITGYTGIKNPLYDVSIVNNASSYSNIYVNDLNYPTSYDWVYSIIKTSFNSQDVDSSYNFFLSSSNNNSVMGIYTNNNGLWNINYNINPFQKNSLYKEKMIGEDYTNYNNNYYYKVNTLGLTSNTGYLLTSNTGPNYPSNYKIAFFGDSGDYVSINNDNNFCYYYNGSIQCNSINTDDYKQIAQGDYGYYEYGDVSDYNNIVANFISGMSTDMINFGNIVQDVWDTIPSFLESVIIVIFILSNILIVYNLVKRR